MQYIDITIAMKMHACVVRISIIRVYVKEQRNLIYVHASYIHLFLE